MTEPVLVSCIASSHPKTNPQISTSVIAQLIRSGSSFKIAAKGAQTGQVQWTSYILPNSYSIKNNQEHEITLQNGLVHMLKFAGDAQSQQFTIVLKNVLQDLQTNPGEKMQIDEGAAIQGSTPVELSDNYGDDVSIIAESLQKAIKQGNCSQAQELASILASRHAHIEMKVLPAGAEGAAAAEEEAIRVKIYVEDRYKSYGTPVTKKVKPSTTISQLKSEMVSCGFPREVQKWIIGKRIPSDTVTLAQCGIKVSDCSIFLYLMSLDAVGLTNEQCYEKYKHIPAFATYQFENNHAEPEEQVYISMHGLGSVGAQAAQQAPEPVNQAMTEPIYEELTYLNTARPAEPARNQTANVARPEPRTEKRLTRVLPPPPPPPPERKPAEGWECPTCTFINVPTRPGCEMCSADRPADYTVPDVLHLPQAEQQRIAREMEEEQHFREAEELQRQQMTLDRERNYQLLMTLEEQGIVSNRDTFDCLICYSEVLPGEGVILRDCLHEFCKLCLADHIRLCEEAMVGCPYQDLTFACTGTIQDREIAAIVTPEVLEKHLLCRLTLAESAAPNSYHCKTANCIGWCIYDDNNNFFKCEVCGHENCLTCKAIHEGQNCKQYQEDLAIKAANDVAARQTKEALERLIGSGEAMYCPTCRIVLQKKDGCDWIRCTMCKTEVCWVTRGPRWGPKGNGDSSAGCKCRLNGGPKCHPNCNNCH